MRIIEVPTTADQITVGQVIDNPTNRGRCLEVNEILTWPGGAYLTFTDTYLGEGVTMRADQPLIRIDTEY